MGTSFCTRVPVRQSGQVSGHTCLLVLFITLITLIQPCLSYQTLVLLERGDVAQPTLVKNVIFDQNGRFGKVKRERCLACTWATLNIATEC